MLYCSLPGFGSHLYRHHHPRCGEGPQIIHIHTLLRHSYALKLYNVTNNSTSRREPDIKTTTTTPIAVPQPGLPLGGFDAVEFGDEVKWMFYTDQHGNIQYIQA